MLMYIDITYKSFVFILIVSNNMKRARDISVFRVWVVMHGCVWVNDGVTVVVTLLYSLNTKCQHKVK